MEPGEHDLKREALFDAIEVGTKLTMEPQDDEWPVFRLADGNGVGTIIPLEPYTADDEDRIIEKATSCGGLAGGIVMERSLSQGDSAPADSEFHYRIYSYHVLLVDPDSPTSPPSRA